MAKVIIEKDSGKDNAEQFNNALKSFSMISNDVKKHAKKHSYFLRKGLKAKQKSLDAFKTYSKKKVGKYHKAKA